MSIDILHIDQAPLSAEEGAILALTLVSCAERVGHVPDDETVRWLHERCASVLTGEQVSDFLESLRAGSGRWRSLLADAASGEGLRATLISTHAMFNPFFGDDEDVPWLRMDACSDSFGGFVDAITISSRYEEVQNSIRAASTTPGMRRTITGMSGVLAIGTGGFLGAHGMAGAAFKSGALIGQAGDRLLDWLSKTSDEGQELATLVLMHAALTCDADDSTAATLSASVADTFLLAATQARLRQMDMAANRTNGDVYTTLYGEKAQFEHLLRLLRVAAECLIGQRQERDVVSGPIVDLPDLSGLSLPDARLVLGLLGVDQLVEEDRGIDGRTRKIWTAENWTVHSAIPAQRTGETIGSVRIILTKSGDVSS